jgi:hypothetical protein
VARSLAFWIDGVDIAPVATGNGNPQKPAVELHFNLWTLSSKNVNYLDIGVRVKDSPKSGSINFYLPFQREFVRYDHELGKTICTSEDLIKAVFNCQFKDMQPKTNDGYYDFTFVSGDKCEPIRFFTDLSEVSNSFPDGVKIVDEIISENKSDGFRLSFPIELFPLVDNREIYFRFRLKLNDSELSKIVTKYSPTFRAVTNNHEVTETIDFRLNEPRNLPKTVSRSLRDKELIQKIHFFLIRDGREEYKLSHINYKRCRILENDLWGQYLGINSETLKEQMLIYHWTTKDNETIDHFSAFAKFSSKPVRWPQITAVLLVTMLAGIFSSLITNYLWQKIEKPVVCNDNQVGLPNSNKTNEIPNSPKEEKSGTGDQESKVK